MPRRIEIFTECLPSGWKWYPNDQFKTGTTEFYVETARCLRDMGHEVTVYYDREPLEYDGIMFMPRTHITGSDIVLSCNSESHTAGDVNVYWTNKFDDRQELHPKYDKMIVISEYQRSIFGDKAKVVGHGCYPERYHSDGQKIKGLCIYTSSPDRGLDFLLNIWPRVKDETGAELVSTYGSGLSEKNMDDLYNFAQFWLHPGQGVELFCISGIKAQAAGCIPVVVPNMALAETIKSGILTTEDKFADDLIQAIKNPPEIKSASIPSWQEQTKLLEEILVN